MSDLAKTKAWLVQCSFPNLKGKTCVASGIIFADSEQLASESFNADVEALHPEGRVVIAKPQLIIGVTVSEEALNPHNSCISVMVV